MNPNTFLKEFELLADQPNAIVKMRQLVLQLAIQGRLVPQNPKEASAKSLLTENSRKRDEIAKMEGLRLPISETELSKGDVPFSLPSGWVCAKLADVAIKLGAGSTPLGGKRVYEKSGIKFLRSQNVWDDGLRLDDVAFISEAVHRKMDGTFVKPRDILLNITGASIGRCALVPDTFDEANVSQHVAIIRLAEPSLTPFLHLCIIAPDFQDRIMRVQVGVSREGLSMARLKEFVIALPPLAEQKRIVAKVEELLRLCDELESLLKHSRTLGEQLLEATIRQLLAA